MSFRNCLDAAFAEQRVRPKTYHEVQERLRNMQEERNADFDGMSKAEWDIKAAQKLEKEMELDRMRRKRMRIIQAAKQDDIRRRINEGANRQRADRSAMSVLEFDPSLQEIGPSVAQRQGQLLSETWTLANEFITSFRSKFDATRIASQKGIERLPFGRDETQLDDVLRAMWPEEGTENQLAKGIAKGLQDARHYLVKRFNRAGGSIRLRKDWGWSVKHDRHSILKEFVEKGTLLSSYPKSGSDRWYAARKAWVDFVFERLDPTKMLDDAGKPMSGAAIRKRLEGTFEEVTQDKPVVEAPQLYSSPINSRIQHRQLHFKSSQAWKEYMEKYGGGDVLDAIIAEMQKLARDTAIVEVMGPYPNATLKMMKEMVAEKMPTAGSIERAQNKLDYLYDAVTGALNRPVNHWFANLGQNYRYLATAARLGTALFSSLSDFGIAGQTAKINGLPIMKLMGNYFNLLSKSDAGRKQAARMGYVMDTWLGQAVGVQKQVGEVMDALKSAKLAEAVLRGSGLSAHTAALRSAFKMTFVGELTDNAGKAFADLPTNLKTAFERHGITEKHWNEYRSTEISTMPETGAEFILPQNIYHSLLKAHESGVRQTQQALEDALDTSRLFSDMIDIEAQFAVVTPTARSRAFTMQGSRPGTPTGEGWRMFMLFRSWMAGFLYLHGTRAANMGGVWNGIKYAAPAALSLTLGGIVANWASDVSQGKSPRPLGWKELYQGVLRGGALGPVGDLLTPATTDTATTIDEAIFGPLWGDMKKAYRIVNDTGQFVFNDGEGPKSAEMRSLIKGFIPGQSLWYTRLLFDRAFADNVEMLFNSGAAKKWEKSERRMQEETGQKFWVPKGSMVLPVWPFTR